MTVALSEQVRGQWPRRTGRASSQWSGRRLATADASGERAWVLMNECGSSAVPLLPLLLCVVVLLLRWRRRLERERNDEERPGTSQVNGEPRFT